MVAFNGGARPVSRLAASPRPAVNQNERSLLWHLTPRPCKVFFSGMTGTSDDLAFREANGLDLPALCVRLYDRHADRIAVKKPRTAVANLERILAAALSLSGRTGFQAMTARHLAREAGVSMGVLYTIIGDKDTLLEMMLDVVTDAVERVLASPPADLCLDPRRRLRWVIDRHVRLTDAMQPWFAFAYMEARSFAPHARERARQAELRTEALIGEALAAGVAQEVFRPLDSEMTAALIKPLLQDWYLKRWKYRRRGVTADAYVDIVVDFITGGIGGAPAATWGGVG